MVISYYNEKEYEELMKLSKQTGLPKSTLIRYLVLGYSPPEGPPVNYGELIYQLRALGNNINQVLHIARTNGILNPVELEKHLTELRSIEKEMHSAFSVDNRR